MIDHHATITKYLDKWIYLMGLENWTIHYVVCDDLPKDRGCEIYAYCLPNYDKQFAEIYFNKKNLTTEELCERIVVHEILHTQDEGVPNSHKMIEPLVDALITVHKRSKQ